MQAAPVTSEADPFGRNQEPLTPKDLSNALEIHR